MNPESEEVSGQTITEALNAALGALGSMVIYVGDQIQEPDPLIEGDKGASNVPGYRGLAYIVFNDFRLRNFANRIPNFSFEVVFSGTETFQLLGSTRIPDAESTEFQVLQAPFVDSNGEVIVIGDRNFDSPPDDDYASKRFVVKRMVGSTFHSVAKIPAPPLHPLSFSTKQVQIVQKCKMDEPGYCLKVQGVGDTDVYMGRWLS